MLGLTAIVLIPLFGAATLTAFGTLFPRKWSGVWASALVGISFVLAVFADLHLAGLPAAHRVVTGTVATFLSGMGPPIGWQLYLDPLSGIWLLVITGVGALIHWYSIGYMAEDPGKVRYFAYLNFFVFAMLLLVLAGNLMVLLIGWALVGLASYFLIGFWYQRASAVRAAKKALVMNTVGDVGILLGLALLYWHFHTVSYSGLFAAFAHATPNQPLFIWSAFLLYIGAMAKSAQFPLHMWLADAMEGPTPVSALIHAATMVTAGVYLVARLYPLLHLAPGIGAMVGDIGAFTAIFAASIAIFQQDIKKVLAYSTLSQLGYMFLGEGVGAYGAGVFHFMTHAFFKALLFLAAGSVIHALAGEQDLGRMGGLAKKMPWTTWSFMAATLAISGIPPFSGFYSKEAVLGSALNHGATVIWLVGVITAGMTALYMFRLFFLAFFGKPRDAHLYEHAHEAPWVMTVPVVVLAVLATVGGFFGDWLNRWLAPTFAMYPGGGSAAIAGGPLWATVLTVGLGVIGFLIAWMLYFRRSTPAKAGTRAIPGKWMLAAWGMDTFWTDLAILPLKATGDLVRSAWDRAILGWVASIGQAVLLWAEDLRPIESGYVRRYGLSIMVGMGALIAYYLIGF